MRASRPGPGVSHRQPGPDVWQRRRVARLPRAAFFSVCAAVTLAVGGLPGGVSAHADDLNNQQSQVDAALAQTQEDLAGATAAEKAASVTVFRVAAKLPAAQAALNVAQGQLASAQAEQNAVAGQLKAAQNALAGATYQLQAAGGVLAAKRRMLGAIARAAYSGGTLAEVNALLESSGPADLVERVGLIHNLLSGTNRTLREVADARAAFASKQASLDATAHQIAALERKSSAALARVQKIYGQAAAAQQSISSLLADRTAALNTTKAFLAAKEREYQLLLKKSRQIAAQLAARGNTAGPGVPGRGGLVWPMNGTKTSPYGYRTDPFTGQQKFHAGQDIAAPSGTVIWAANAGVVVFTETPDQSGGYGNYTCIDHGGGFATCYAHQSAFAVHAGQSVTRGQVIGYEGSTGASTGPHLHFETRINGNPVDPMQYY